MGNQYEKKITWTIKNFSSLQSKEINSDHFVVGGCKWRLRVYPKGERYINDYLSLYLDVDDSETLPSGWRRHTKFRLTLINQFREYGSKVHEVQMWFDHKTPNSGSREMILLTKLHDKNGGFLVNGDVKIVAEVDVLEVTGKSDVLEETSFVESTDVNGFQVLPPQLVESVTVSSLFKDYPDIESKFCPTNPHLRTSCMNILVSLTDILCQSPEKLSIGDLADAYSALRYVTKAGFKLNWLEEKLKEAGKTRLQEIEEDLKGLKQKCADMEALVEFLR